MKILITNDDGYNSGGIQALVRLMKPFGELTVIAPKYHQSAMSTAVTMGLKPIAVKHLGIKDGVSWWYLDGTPASCVKFAIDEVFKDGKPDLVVSGINHGVNTASAAIYSATLGAAEEAALAGIPSVGVSLDNLSRKADFSVVEELFPALLQRILSAPGHRFGTYYNVNFPYLPAQEIKGVRVCHQGINHWEREFRDYEYGIFERLDIKPEDMGIIAMPEVEEGEKVYIMAGDIVDNGNNVEPADHHLVAEGYITIVAHKIDSTDYERIAELEQFGFNQDF